MRLTLCAVTAAGLLAAVCGAQARATNEFRFRTPAEVVRSLAAIDQLFGHEAAPQPLPEEEYNYRVKATWFFLRLPMGLMNTTLRAEKYEGRSVYHIHQWITIYGRYQEEDAFIDARGLFPYEYRLRTRRPFENDRQHIVQWDPLGGAVYISKEQMAERGAPRKRRQEARLLGQQEPRDARDPLSAMLLYRLKCLAATSTVPWTANILMSRDERYTLLCAPCSNTASGFAGKPGVAKVAWSWKARACDAEDKLVFGWLCIGSNAAPVRYSTRVWNAEGAADLTRGTIRRAAADRQ